LDATVAGRKTEMIVSRQGTAVVLTACILATGASAQTSVIKVFSVAEVMAQQNALFNSINSPSAIQLPAKLIAPSPVAAPTPPKAVKTMTPRVNKSNYPGPAKMGSEVSSSLSTSLVSGVVIGLGAIVALGLASILGDDDDATSTSTTTSTQ
jgi:hypothetical protein